MREGALPSPVNQARAMQEVLALAKRENYRVNLIEAYDQPWKRQLEGTVGGYWGLFDSVRREVKYPPGVPISNFPLWKWQMGAGLVLSVLVFVSAWATTRRRPWTPLVSSWVAVGLIATTAGVLLGVAADKMFFESYGVGGWLQWGALLLAGLVASVLGANAVVSGRPLPTFLDMFGPRREEGGRLALSMWWLGASLVVTTLIAAETALGFVFDPRYRDFPYASLTMAVVPFACLMMLNRPQQGHRPMAEAVFAGLLVGSVVYVGINEGRDNWQSLWTCAGYLVLALTLWRARAAQSPK
jgi:glucan 1,3-beta-glucosidase